jgi:hypothetical protein
VQRECVHCGELANTVDGSGEPTCAACVVSIRQHADAHGLLDD